MSEKSDDHSEGSLIRIYELGFPYEVEVEWYDAIVEKFSDQLPDIAGKIGDQFEEIGSWTIFMHRFAFGDEEVLIASYYDEDREVISVGADLVAYEEEVGSFQHDDEEKPVMTPVPANAARNRMN